MTKYCDTVIIFGDFYGIWEVHGSSVLFFATALFLCMQNNLVLPEDRICTLNKWRKTAAADNGIFLTGSSSHLALINVLSHLSSSHSLHIVKWKGVVI